MFGFWQKQKHGTKRGAWRRHKRRSLAQDRKFRSVFFSMLSNADIPLFWIKSKHKRRKEKRRMEGHGNGGSAVGTPPGLRVIYNGWTKAEGNPGQAHDIQGDDSARSSGQQ